MQHDKKYISIYIYVCMYMKEESIIITIWGKCLAGKYKVKLKKPTRINKIIL